MSTLNAVQDLVQTAIIKYDCLLFFVQVHNKNDSTILLFIFINIMAIY